jgi:hypothetical protein
MVIWIIEKGVIMSRAIFVLEQQMLEFATVTSDIEMLNRHFTEDPKWENMDGELCDAILNKYGAIQELYEVKFQNMWDTFEIVCKEYHDARNVVAHRTEEEL